MRRLLRPALATSIFALFLATGLLLSPRSLAPTAEAAPSDGVWHVSPSGDDTTGDGSAGNPLLTIQEAVNQAASGEAISLEGTFTESVTVSGGKNLLFLGVGLGASSGTSLTIATGVADGATLHLNRDDLADGLIAGVVFFTFTSSGMTVEASGGTFTITSNAGTVQVNDPFGVARATLTATQSTTITPPVTAPDVFVVTRGGTSILAPFDNDTIVGPGPFLANQLGTTPATPEHGTFTPQADGVTFEYANDGSGYPADRFFYQAYDPYGSDAAEHATIFIAPQVPPDPNPALAASCGLDIVLVMDSSGSIAGSDAPNPTPSSTGTQFEKMQQALIDFVNAFLPGTSTQFALVEFNTQAAQRLGFTNDAATLIAEISQARQVTAAPDGMPVGFTNYEDALFETRQVFLSDTNERPTRPNLIVFASDGVPTVFGNPGDPVQFGEDTTGTTSPPFQNVAGEDENQWLIELEPAVAEANLAKASPIGARILPFGIEIAALDASLDGAVTFSLEQISGPGAVTTTGFDTLGADLAQLAADLCGGTVTVNKLFDADGTLADDSDQTPEAGVEFALTPSSGTTTSPMTTEADGAAVFAVDGISGQITAGLAETIPGGEELLDASCSANGVDITGSLTIDTAAGTVSGIPLDQQDIVSCTFINGPAPVATGTLTVKKDFVDQTLLPASSPTATVTLDGGTPSNFDLTDSDPAVGGGDNTGAQTFSDGATVTISEVGSNVDLADYDAAISCDDGVTSNASLPAQVTIQGNVDISCTLTNTRKSASLTITKDTVPDDTSEWAITVEGMAVGTLQDDGIANGETMAVIVPAGELLTVAEDGVGGASQNDAYRSSFACDDPASTQGLGHTIDLPALSDGADVTCTFTNTFIPMVTITVEKVVVDNDGSAPPAGTEFEIDLTCAVGEGGSTVTFNLADGESDSWAGLPSPVACNVSETNSQGADQVLGEEDTFPLFTSDHTFTITNVYGSPQGSIIVTKDFVDLTDVPASSPTVAIDVDGVLYTGLGDMDATGEEVRAAGTVAIISEAGEGGVDLGQYSQALSCSDSGGSVPVTPVSTYFEVTIGTDQINCTLTNTRRQAILTIEKDVDPDDSSQWQILIDGTPRATLGDGGSTFFTLPAGVAFTISEAPADAGNSGLYAPSFSCTDGQSGSVDSLSITLSEGVDVTCTFTNTLNSSVDLAITKDDGGVSVSPGGIVVYALGYGNNGNVTATGVTITDVVPANATFNSGASTGGWICTPDASAGSVCTISIGSLGAGVNGTVDFAVAVDDPTAATQIDNTADIADDGNNGADVDPADNTASDQTPVIQPVAPPGFAKVFSPDTINVGATSTLTFTIDNTASGTAATALDFTDVLPAGVMIATPANASTTCTGGTLTATSGSAAIGYTGGSVAASASCTISVDVTSSTAGTHSNVSGDLTSSAGNSGNATDDLTVTEVAPEADLSIAKADDVDPITAGGTLTYSVTVSNAGPDVAENVVVTDTLPAGVTFVSTSGCTEDPSGVPTCSLGAIASGGTAQFTVTVTVDAATSGTITNNVSVSSDTPDPDNANNSASEDTTVTAPTAPAIDIQKTPDQQTIEAGGLAEFTITVTNIGGVGLVGVEVTDALASDCDFSIGSLAVEESVSYGCSIEGVQSSFTNVAVVTGEVPETEGSTVTDSDSAFVQVGSTPPPPPPPPPITITVVKQVTTSGIGQAPSPDTEFAFELECLGPDFSFSLADGESFQASIAANTQCSLTETDSQGASAVSGEFSNQLLTGSQTFTVTNNYHEDEPIVLGTAITKTLTSADPAATGEEVTFDIAVTFEGDVMPNAELVDSYDPRYLEFVSASVAGAALDCDAFPAGSTLSLAVCDLGDATGPFTVTTHFIAVAPTVPGRTINTAEVSYDVDGDGVQPRLTIGPVNDDVEVVEVLALAPLGDGAANSSPASGLVALIAASVAAALGARVVMRRRRKGQRAA